MNYTPYTSADNAPHVSTKLCNLMGRLTIRITTPVIDVRVPEMCVAPATRKVIIVQSISCTYDDAMRLVADFIAHVAVSGGEYTYTWTLKPIAL